MQSPDFFVFQADFPAFRPLNDICGRWRGGPGARAGHRWDGMPPRTGRPGRSCGGHVRGGALPVRSVWAARNGFSLPPFGRAGWSARCFLSRIRLLDACKRPRRGGALRTRPAAIWKSRLHALSLQPNPFVEPVMYRRKGHIYYGRRCVTARAFRVHVHWFSGFI